MVKPLGGRGKKAPYNTVVLRVPEALVPGFEQTIEQYRVAVINGDESAEPAANLSQVHLNVFEAIELTKKILRAKISKKESILKLLQVLYRTPISAQDLTEN